MGEQKGFWNNATISAIVSTIVLSVMGAFAAHFGVTVDKALDVAVRLWLFWTADVTLPRWAFWFWATVSVLLVVFAALHVYVALTGPAREATPSTRATPKPQAPAYRTYTTDVLFKWRWRWKITPSGEIYAISMYCPKCDQQMAASDIRRQSYDQYAGICSHCRYDASVDGDSPLDMHDKVKRAAERKVRTGEWQKA